MKELKYFKAILVVPGTDGDVENGPCAPLSWTTLEIAEDEGSAEAQANAKAKADWESPNYYEPGVPSPSDKELGECCPVCASVTEISQKEYDELDTRSVRLLQRYLKKSMMS